ncbi:MAG TPA: NfeD family protein, partial [Gammaproteobacteria bacterium]|nr:NfeD family protein [Gammaproteobacteria bacterium]
APPGRSEVDAMTWWGWCIVGAVLLAAELFAVDAQFYLIFIGAAALVVGFLGLIGVTLPGWAQWLIFAVLAIVTMLTVRKQLYQKLRSRPLGNVASDVAQRVRIPEALPPGKTMRVEYRGSGWTALNVGDRPIPAGEEVLIEAVEGLTLRVRLN